MITYVNTVFVSNNATATLLDATALAGITAANVGTYKGRFVVYDIDASAYAVTATTTRFKIGMITGKMGYDHKGIAHPVIKWSNDIKVADIKSVNVLEYPGADTEDEITIDLHSLSAATLTEFAKGGKRIIVRLTFKDMPNRYRKWTESYEYVTVAGDTKATIATAIATMINKEWKRARVNAVATTTAGSEKVVLTALPYDDDNTVDSLNWANKVRFNANMYWTDPAAEGWESLNKNFPTGVTITKVPGSQYAASAKLVRDRESQAMGYLGILNRGEGTWPIIKPDMETQLSGQYDAITLEFENMYRAADDIFRKTKQTVEIYVNHTAGTSALETAISTAMGDKSDRATSDTTTEKGNIV